MSLPIPTQRGLFIVVEGLDRAGKSTQVERLRTRLASWAPGKPGSEHQVQVAKFPDRTTPTGKVLDAYLKSSAELDDRAAHLLFSANRWEAMPQLRQTLLSGSHVIADRYAFSGVAYTGAKSVGKPPVPTGAEDLTFPGPSREWLMAPDQGLLSPDLVIFLSVSAQAAASRGGYGEERYEKAAFQRVVATEFSALSKVVAQGGVPWYTIDASGTQDEVEHAIWNRVQQLQPPGPIQMELFQS